MCMRVYECGGRGMSELYVAASLTQLLPCFFFTRLTGVRTTSPPVSIAIIRTTKASCFYVIVVYFCACVFFFYISSVLLLFVNLLKCSPKQNCFSTAYKTIKLRSRIRQSIRNCCFCLLPFILRSACRLPFTVLAFNLELVIATLFSWLSANFTIHKCCFSVNTLPAALSVFHTFSLSLSLTISLFFISSRNQENLHYAKPLASLFCSCLMRLNLFRLDLFYFYFFFFENRSKICLCWLVFLASSSHKSHNSWRQTKCRQGQLVSFYSMDIHMFVSMYVCVTMFYNRAYTVHDIYLFCSCP